MQELRELINVVSKHKVKQIEVIGNDFPANDSKFRQLYDIVHNGDVNTDIEAASLLYPQNNNSKDSYSKLKNRLKSRLINTLFFIDINQPQFTDIQQAFFNCNKNWLAARTLLSRGATRAAIKLAEATIREAIKFEFTELIIYLSKMLFWHYSLYNGTPAKYNRYVEIHDKAQNDLFAETLAEKYYSEIMLMFARSQANVQVEHSEMISKYSDELRSEYAHIISFRFIRISYLLHIIRYQTAHDYQNAIVACHDAISIISQKPYQSKGAVFSFSLRLLSCYIQVKRYQEAEELALKYVDSLTSGSYDWYIIQFYHFLLHTHGKNYDKAYDVLEQAVGHPRFEHFFANHKQLWYVNQAYIHFLIAIGKIQPKEASDSTKFRLYRFLNDIPIYSKDKRGINIAILIVHVLFLLQQRKFSQIIDRVDALNQYCHRYLRRDDTFRANCFIKMLLQMAKADFNRIRTERYAEKYKAKLESMTLNVADGGIEVEVIPYEDLWDLVLDLLD